jgi:hypothetical protein
MLTFRNTNLSMMKRNVRLDRPVVIGAVRLSSRRRRSRAWQRDISRALPRLARVRSDGPGISERIQRWLDGLRALTGRKLTEA